MNHKNVPPIIITRTDLLIKLISFYIGMA